MQCKILLDVRGDKPIKYCIFPDKIKPNFDANKKIRIPREALELDEKGEIPVLDANINLLSYNILNSKNRVFELRKKDGNDIIAVIHNGQEKGKTGTLNLGMGTFGVTTLLYDYNVVIKEPRNDMDVYPEDFIREIALYKLFTKSDCIPHMHGFDVQPNIFMDVGHMTLSKFLSDLDEKSDIDVKKLCYNLLSCMAYIGSQGIIHCDLKPDNLLLSYEGKIQIIDWGSMAVNYNDKNPTWKSTAIHTPTFEAPEKSLIIQLENDTKTHIHHYRYNNRTDIYCIALIMICIYKKKYYTFMDSSRYIIENNLGNIHQILFPKGNSLKILRKYVCGNYNQKKLLNDGLKELLPDDTFRDLICGMLMFNPKLRYTYQEALTHPYFKGIYVPQSYPIYMNNPPVINNINNYWRFPGVNRTYIFDEAKQSNLIATCLIQQLRDMVILYASKINDNEKVKNMIMACGIIGCHVVNYPTNFNNEKELKPYVGEVIDLLGGRLLYPTLYSYACLYDAQDKIPYKELYSRPDIYAKPLHDTIKEYLKI